MKLISIRIYGVPYPQDKVSGAIAKAKEWSDKVENETKRFRKIKKPCHLKCIFFLYKDKFPKDYPFGTDLDNLLKRFLDALNKTVFNNGVGKDSCAVRITTRKVKISNPAQSGAKLEISTIDF